MARKTPGTAGFQTLVAAHHRAAPGAGARAGGVEHPDDHVGAGRREAGVEVAAPEAAVGVAEQRLGAERIGADGQARRARRGLGLGADQRGERRRSADRSAAFRPGRWSASARRRCAARRRRRRPRRGWRNRPRTARDRRGRHAGARAADRCPRAGSSGRTAPRRCSCRAIPATGRIGRARRDARRSEAPAPSSWRRAIICCGPPPR